MIGGGVKELKDPEVGSIKFQRMAGQYDAAWQMLMTYSKKRVVVYT